MAENNNFDKSKLDAQIRNGKISDLEKEKSNSKLAEKIESGLNIHSMPNDFRAGKFNTSVHPNDIKKEKGNIGSSGGAHKHKYVGVLIVVLGVFVLGGLGYFLYDYIVESPQGANNQVATEDTDKDNNDVNNEQSDNKTNEESEGDLDKDSAEDSAEDESTVDEDNKEEETDDTETATSTEEVIDEDPIDEETSTSTEPVLVKDTDNDGLTDAEEHLLNTNINLEDSDSDGYNDSEEVVNLYNPAGSNTLKDNPNIKEYINPLHNYSILHPKRWTQQVSSGGDSVMFMNDNEGFFQVSVEDNDEGLSIEDWYKQEFALEDNDKLNYFSEDKEMLVSDDGLVVYYTDQEKIYVFSYTVMSENPNYPTIFKAFVNSFSIS